MANSDLDIKNESDSDSEEIFSDQIDAAFDFVNDAASSSTSMPKEMQNWDTAPTNNSLSVACRMRVKRDFQMFYSSPPPGIFVIPQDGDFSTVHAVILGPDCTPYEGGFFEFKVQFPYDYPIQPPRVKFLTTDAGRVRFNPNLYACGKVCLSILGTWSGPQWTAAQSLSSVLISIQSLLNDKPYHNEPGFEDERIPGDVKRYNNIVRYETLRVAVCAAMEECLNKTKSIQHEIREIYINSFDTYFDAYIESCEKLKELDLQPLNDPFSNNHGKFNFDRLKKRLLQLKARVESFQKENPS